MPNEPTEQEQATAREIARPCSRFQNTRCAEEWPDGYRCPNCEQRDQIVTAIAAAAATKKPALRPVRSHTYTFVVMEVSQSTYDEVHAKLLAAGYDHAIHKEVRDGTVLDMNGIALGLKS